VRFIALSLFLLHTRLYAYWCRHDKVTASDKVGRFFETQCSFKRDVTSVCMNEMAAAFDVVDIFV